MCDEIKCDWCKNTVKKEDATAFGVWKDLFYKCPACNKLDNENVRLRCNHCGIIGTSLLAHTPFPVRKRTAYSFVRMCLNCHSNDVEEIHDHDSSAVTEIELLW